jgi:hypothetical protein
MNKKPVVFYKTDIKPTLVVGERAWVFPINHTSPWVSNKYKAYTSKVLRVLASGVFETQNSIYKPEEMQ